MPIGIDRYELQQLIEQGAQVVEVLPSQEYDQEHIAGAVNIPLPDLDTDARTRLSPDRPVVVYCNDYLFDMSPRAAKRLQRLGFTDVYDYMPGKVDWMAAGLARGGNSVELNTSDVADPDVPNFDLRSPAARALAVLDNESLGFGAVIDADAVVHGVLKRGTEAPTADGPVERTMQPGPTTVRANEPLEPLLDRMRDNNVDEILVTTPDGRLIGLLDRERAKELLHEQSRAHEPPLSG